LVNQPIHADSLPRAGANQHTSAEAPLEHSTALYGQALFETCQPVQFPVPCRHWAYAVITTISSNRRLASSWPRGTSLPSSKPAFASALQQWPLPAGRVRSRPRSSFRSC